MAVLDEQAHLMLRSLLSRDCWQLTSEIKQSIPAD